MHQDRTVWQPAGVGTFSRTVPGDRLYFDPSPLPSRHAVLDCERKTEAHWEEKRDRAWEADD